MNETTRIEHGGETYEFEKPAELPTIRPLPALRRFADQVTSQLSRTVGASGKVLNPLTGKPMNADEAEYVTQLRTVRRNAKPATRSGNPAKREPAKKVIAAIGPMLGQVYGQDAVKTLRREVGA